MITRGYTATQSVSATSTATATPPLGIAAAKIVDRRVQDGDTAAVLWVHDARGVEPHQLHRLLPTVGRAKLAIVSSTRKTQLIAAFDAMREQGLSVPDYDIRVIPNPIDRAFYQSDAPTPDSLAAFGLSFGGDISQHLRDGAHIQREKTSQLMERQDRHDT